MKKIISCLKIMRLQFYPMTFVAYGIGAAIAFKNYENSSWTVFWAGYCVLFLLELGAVLSNEYYDYQSDKINKNAGTFNGGSQVIVQGELSLSEVKKGIWTVFFLIIASSLLLLTWYTHDSKLLPAGLIFLGILLAFGYTIPPFKFCYRGFGEIVVGITHGPYMILCGFVFQTGVIHDKIPWLISIPLLISIVGAIILANIPDYAADKTVSKKSLAVLIGPRRAGLVAIGVIVLAAISYVILWVYGILNSFMGSLGFIVVPYAAMLSVSIMLFLKSNNYDRKINRIMQMSLTYIILFGLIPLLHVLYG